MIVSGMKTLIVIVTLCTARFIDRPFGESPTTLIGRQDVNYCKADCTPTRCAGISCTIGKRHMLEDAYWSSNATEYVQFDKRTIEELRQREVGSYIKDNAFLSTVNTICPMDAESGGGYIGPSFCVQQAFSSATLNNGRYLVGTANTALVGCTVLTVVSARGVYMV
ncbi:hypothetical protein E5D57_011088 [Metarhizium anisopliae]|nr:hypothetical protein E5D57_011088 [Metarhizium anisopliae]